MDLTRTGEVENFFTCSFSINRTRIELLIKLSLQSFLGINSPEVEPSDSVDARSYIYSFETRSCFGKVRLDGT